MDRLTALDPTLQALYVATTTGEARQVAVERCLHHKRMRTLYEIRGQMVEVLSRIRFSERLAESLGIPRALSPRAFLNEAPAGEWVGCTEGCVDQVTRPIVNTEQ